MLKSSLNLIIKTNKQQGANELGQQFSYLFFTKSEAKQQVCYVNTSSSSFYSNSYQTSLNSDEIYFKSNTSQLAIEVSFACSEPPLACPVQRSHFRLNFQMKPI